MEKTEDLVVKNYFAVFIGGSCGSLLREIINPHIQLHNFLTSTFTVNIIACFLIGILYSIRNRIHISIFHFAAIGFCGGLSTFSSFIADLYSFYFIHGFLQSIIVFF